MDASEYRDALREVNEAIQRLLRHDELSIAWVVTIDVVGPDGRRYLAQRAGGGIDGLDRPTTWTVMGMVQAASDAAREQLATGSVLIDDDGQELEEPE